MNKKQKRVWESILERDLGTCVLCQIEQPTEYKEGMNCIEVHHICGRGFAEAWTPRNMVTLCAWHHRLDNKGGGADNPEDTKTLLNWLAEYYEYDYSGEPFAEALRRFV